VNESDKVFIERIEVQSIKIPLKKPYQLSFATLKEFLSIQVTLYFSDGHQTLAEVVPLVGYNEESSDVILTNLNIWIREIIGIPVMTARQQIELHIKKFPFSTSPILTGIDLYQDPIYSSKCQTSPSFVVPTAANKSNQINNLIQQKISAIKIKLSDNVIRDIGGLNQVRKRILESNCLIRFDANQAYSFDDSKRFFSYLLESGIIQRTQYVEQPMKVGLEEKMGMLRREFEKVPIMFDESIICIDDIDLAKRLDINFIKLKLFKQGGIKETIAMAKYANSQSIGVIIGNGVATGISNSIENKLFDLYPDYFLTPLESNGFQKIN